MTQLTRAATAALVVLAGLPALAACAPAAPGCGELDTVAVQAPALKAVKAKLGDVDEGDAHVTSFGVVGARAQGSTTTCFVRVDAKASGRVRGGMLRQSEGTWFTKATLQDGRTQVGVTQPGTWPEGDMHQPADRARVGWVVAGAVLLGLLALATLWELLRRRPVRVPAQANQPIATPVPRRAGPARWLLWVLGLGTGVAGLLVIPRTLQPGTDTLGTDTAIGAAVYGVGLLVMALAWLRPAGSRPGQGHR